MPAHLTLRTCAIVGITLLALVLGGSTELWAQAVTALVATLLILIFPPRVTLGLIPTLVVSLVMAIALAAFLPAGLGLMPDWWHHLTEDLHAPLGNFRTPQPWITLQACGLLFFGLVWTYYLFAQEWTPAEKSQTLRLFVLGILLLAVVTILSYLTGYRIPGWNQEQNRGWFPNRNQTADVLAIGGIVNYVVAFKSLQKRKWTEGFWVASLALTGIALVITYSRAGILMFFGGIGLWHILSLFHVREKKNIKYTAIGLASLLLLLSLFLLFGGTTLERFLKVSDPDNPSTWEYRTLIQEDALKISLQTPLLGVGLGNFEPVFTSMRNISADQNRTLHPESDWLWMAVEMGWLAPLLIVIGLWWWMRQCLPFAVKSGEAMRRAALVAAVLFVLHGFVDVSGHRLGTILVGLLMASLSLSPANRRWIHPWTKSVFRLLAILLLAMGSWWLMSIRGDQGPPTTATLARLQTNINLSAADGRLASVAESANAALEIAPLDWTYYFRRGSAEAFRTGGTDRAVADFRIARFLEPHWIDLCMNEGEIWLAVNDPAHCLDAWHEALRRTGKNGGELYSRMLNLAQKNDDIHHGLMAFTVKHPDYLITFLTYATPEEEKTEIDDLLTRDPNLHSLNTEQQKQLFAVWYAHGDQDELARLLLGHEDWQAAGWPYLSQHFAGQQDFALATATALRYMPTPNIPQIPPNKPLPALTSHFNDHPDDVVEGVMLCQAQIRLNQIDEALSTIDSLERLKDCPRYIFYLKARLCAKKQDWEQAWNALVKFGII